MNKILISIDKNCLIFSKYNKEINPENLNNTNIINTKNLKFTEEYLKENVELMSTFLNLIILKFKINKVVIKNIEISETVLTLINALEIINEINFKEDKELTYTVCTLLLENRNLKSIECYSLPIIMFYRFNKDIIQTRCNILSKSNFIKVNEIETFSDVFNKTKIMVPDNLCEDDVNDIICFISSNRNLKKIEFLMYNKKNLEATLNLLKENNLKNIKIIIHETDDKTKEILRDIKIFDKLNKKYKVNIKIKYSKEYKEKNKIKELNLLIIKNTLFVCMIISFILFFAYKILEKNNTSSIEKNINNIKEKVEEVIIEETEKVEEDKTSKEASKQQYISSYYKNYSKVYSELIKINKDTVGWITINNTKINYPVVQALDNDYYLNHAFDKTKNNIGWLYVDYRNNMDNLDKNTIIYGHSMIKSGLMFTTLEKVLDSKWYSNQNNLEISFSVKDQEIKWKIFSIYTIEKTNDYLYTNFKSSGEFLAFINLLKNRSIHNFNVELNENSKILTLSTCYKNDNNRLVVHAVML